MKNKDFYSIEDVIRMDAEIQINKSVNKNGLEGCEDKIKDIYSSCSGIRTYLLDILYTFWRHKI